MSGARVHWGRCREDEGAPAYWPWVQALRAYVRDADPVALAWQLGGGAAEVAQLVPEVAEQLGRRARGRELEGEEARFRLFDSVTSLLSPPPRDRPMVIVLDDLHWADEPSLLLLKFAARELAGSGLLILGTYRDVELGRHHPLARVLGESRRVEGARRVTLRGSRSRRRRALHRDGRRHRRRRPGWPRRCTSRPRATRSSSARSSGCSPARARSTEGGAAGRARDPAGRPRGGRPPPRPALRGRNKALRVAAVIGREFDGRAGDEGRRALARRADASAADEAIAERLVDRPGGGALLLRPRPRPRHPPRGAQPGAAREAPRARSPRRSRRSAAATWTTSSASSPTTSSPPAPRGDLARAIDYASSPAAGHGAARLRGRGRALRAGARGVRADRRARRAARAATCCSRSAGADGEPRSSRRRARPSSGRSSRPASWATPTRWSGRRSGSRS